MRRAALIGLVTLVLLGILSGPTTGALVQVDVPADTTAMDARVTADGTAAWTVTYRVELDSPDREAAFEDLEADVAANRSAYLDRFGDRIRATIATAENATGRSMTLRNLSVSTSRTGISDAYGELTYAFEWGGFAPGGGEGREFRVGDAIRGLYLDENTSLTIGWPGGYEPRRVTPEPTATAERSVTWRGPRDFGPEAPQVSLRPAAGGPSLWLLAVVGLVIVGAVGAVGVWWRRRGGFGRSDAPTPASANIDATADDPPPELLSNREQVVHLLEEAGGRMKQQEIASRLDWTDAKTSQVIGDLREDDAVETFRIGRENVVTLPGEDL